MCVTAVFGCLGTLPHSIVAHHGSDAQTIVGEYAAAPARLGFPVLVKIAPLANRVVIAPMHQYSAVNGLAQDWHVMNVGRYAAGGGGRGFWAGPT